MPTTTALSPLWKISPSSPKGYFVNSIGASFDGASVIAATFYKDYSQSTLEQRRVETSPRSTVPSAQPGADSQDGTFGTYCYDRSGKLLWKDEYAGWQGLFWVDCASAAAVCASGGWYSNSPYAGIVRAYDTGSGSRLLDGRTQGRVNQVSLSADGSVLIAASEGLYHYQNMGGLFAQQGQPLLVQAGDSVSTAFVAGDGSLVVAATVKRGIFVFSLNQGVLKQLGNWPWPSTTGCCHSVVVTPDGMAFAVGGSGGCYALFDLDTFLLTGKPTLLCQALGKAVIYSVAISADGKGLAAVANVSSGGNKGQVYCHLAGSATPTWSCATVNSPNRLVWNSAVNQIAVADGYPDGCPGNFYLIDSSNGALLWSYTSGNMAWGVALSPGGELVAGGSDDGYAYAFA